MATKKTKPAKKAATKKAPKLTFKKDDYIVYPAHGVGRVTGVERELIADFDIEVYVVVFEQDKMTLRVPTDKAKRSGMRALANENVMKDAFTTLKGRPRIKRTMWSRRAQEYESKINSGDLILLSEVVRDLYRTEDQPDQSYSERQLYECAIDRMVREVAAVMDLDHGAAMDKVVDTLMAARARAAAKLAAKKEAESENEDGSEAAA
ncbi:MAG TPA: CarD family transcriptional regulator [Hellea balneolensis]|uniref:CarD family transcriptional regulator n=1 Tax=Hellea balneolensis TaxID=287478 RepID=A0A7C5LSD0_9PROT|nr:CarD family transcriptional regulator [Hellea balneolensis]